MSKVLVVGNVLKDVYLKLDGAPEEFERDERGIDWLNLCFNGAAHKFFQRTSVYGGAAVTLSVLAHLGVEAQIMGSATEFKSGEISWQGEPADYRYILCHDGQICYFVPGKRRATDWAAPSGTPEWILIDRSAVVSQRLVEEVRNFLKFSPETKLAVYAGRSRGPSEELLLELADIIFLEEEPPVHTAEKIVDKIEVSKPRKQLTCHITPRRIVLGEAEESWVLPRADMLTHLTVYSTIMATVIGVISAGGSAQDALLWARINAEQSTLQSSLSARKLQELAKAEQEKRSQVRLLAKTLMAAHKGILAADESDRTLTERLVSFGIPASEQVRRDYRRLLLTTPELKQYVSGVILTPETAREQVQRNTNYVEFLAERGVMTGIKAETGQARLGDSEEVYTTGIEDLYARLREYYALGARFAKWHLKLAVQPGPGGGRPSYEAVERGAELLAEFARQCELAGLVAVIESDVLHGGAYSAEQSAEVTNRVLSTVFAKLDRRGVDPEKVLLKTNMVMAGKDAPAASTPREVGMATAAILKHVVPRNLAGVLLLGGGQPANTATANLKAIRQEGGFPWPVSFAFGRPLQDPVMATWQGRAENLKAAQAALRRHLEDNTR